jgi:hypothetical protein
LKAHGRKMRKTETNADASRRTEIIVSRLQQHQPWSMISDDVLEQQNMTLFATTWY